mmetsp:Transcript_669/g.1289  ORF Transcript_669/g.1289 Transcript_669/m.1289 type:complete len:727 (-) Transcript_669:1103-3283(-)
MGAPGSEVTVTPPKDPWDGDTWGAKLVAIASQPMSAAVRDSYELFLAQYPTAGRYWRIYAEHAARSRKSVGGGQSEDEVNPASVFARGVAAAPTSIELWRSYIAFAREAWTARAEVVGVFDAAVYAVGLDLSAHAIWSEFVEFVKSWEAPTSHDEATKRDAVRRVYQRAVCSPIHNLDAMWREYEAFENQAVNKELVRGLLAEFQPKYFEARAEFRARKNRREGLQLGMLATPPRGIAKEEEQAALWRKYIVLERSNPNGLAPEELHKRVEYAYEQALGVLYRYPDLWVDAAQYHADSGFGDAAERLTARARIALPSCSFVWLFSCNLLESLEKLDAARALYKDLLETVKSPAASATAKGTPEMNATLTYAFFLRFVRRNDGLAAARKVFLNARKMENIGWELYVAAADVELMLNKQETVAQNVYELGMKRFGENVAFVLKYIEFLWRCNREQKLRVLFDQVLDALPANDARIVAVWDKYVEFESAYGDIEATSAAVRRRADALGAPEPDPRKKGRGGPSKSGELDLSVYLPSAVDMALSQCSLFNLQPVNADEMAEILMRRSEVEGGTRVAITRSSASTRGKPQPKSSGAAAADEPTSGQGSSDTPESTRPLSLEEGLARMVGMIPPNVRMQPPPDLNAVFQFLQAVPASFEESPAGGVSTAGKRENETSADAANGAGDDAAAKRTKVIGASTSDADGSTRAWSARAQAPTIDVFRQRQALKQRR